MQMTGKRIFDLCFSFLAILGLIIPSLILALIIMAETRGGVFYSQVRVGRKQKHFKLLKFRTMHVGSDKKGLLTIGENDNRITKTGKFLRKYKLDELPQLRNIFIGDMSFVGPRPEVPKYVSLYNEEQKKVFILRPGLTDYASLEYINENELLSNQSDPEKYYIEKIMPAKLQLNLKYLESVSLKTDLKIIFRTIFKIFKK